MKPGSVLVDIAVDQGGCFEDTQPTTHADPTYMVHDSVFYCVANMPGAVPNTSTYALTNATLPYAVALADKGWQQALRDDHSLALGLNTHAGKLTNGPVAEAHGLDAVALEEAARLGRDARREASTGSTEPPQLDDRWCSAVRTYLDHLVVERGLADNTLTSYRRDLRRYVEFLLDHDVDRARRRRRGRRSTEFLMALREGDADHPPLSASSAGRTVVAVRGFHKFAVRDGLATHDPSAGVRPPAPAKRLPKALPLADVEAILDAAGCGRARRWRCATGRCWRCSTAPAPGSPRRSGSTSTTSTSSDGTVLLRGKGSKERIVPVGSLRPRRRSRRTSSGARPDLVAAGTGRRRRSAVPQRPGRAAVAAERLDGARQGRRAGRGDRGGLTAHAAALVRDPPARRRRRRPGGAGAARPRLGDDHPDLHAGHRRQPARGVRHRAPARARADAAVASAATCTGSSTSRAVPVHSPPERAHTLSPDSCVRPLRPRAAVEIGVRRVHRVARVAATNVSVDIESDSSPWQTSQEAVR